MSTEFSALLARREQIADEIAAYVRRYHAAGGVDVEETGDYLDGLAELGRVLGGLPESISGDLDVLPPSSLLALARVVTGDHGDVLVGISALALGFRLYLRRGGFAEVTVSGRSHRIETFPAQPLRCLSWTGPGQESRGVLDTIVSKGT